MSNPPHGVTLDVCNRFIRPATSSTHVSYAELLSHTPFVQPANWYVSHTWHYLFLEVVDALSVFQASLSSPASFWFCLFVNNQHAQAAPFAFWATRFQRSMPAIGHLVLVVTEWRRPVILKRAWCLLELYTAVSTHASIHVALPSHQVAAVRAHPDAFATYARTISMRRSTASVASDKAAIVAMLHAAIGLDAVDATLATALAMHSTRASQTLATLAVT
ncbi:hypothetical protein SDRG_00090 [Saprolegnia diclina VS20]|uniref:Uncharacterized protein n=1 Tax=Saprolegnia diclina (strain VS20) TaxID=1156394 RepID=T0SH83_SAPDV|nr:hypothetical protein SDRG_00090 [Saprolegnia diclina VS20]EQC42352.1 hypothetical protein SDRG_00090 [Saprolegnia diclina VS20]|eukprot:XP_008603775.1 hypothetical protein SDRG_00090 [Saprolegnia diclina VS20]